MNIYENPRNSSIKNHGITLSPLKSQCSITFFSIAVSTLKKTSPRQARGVFTNGKGLVAWINQAPFRKKSDPNGVCVGMNGLLVDSLSILRGFCFGRGGRTRHFWDVSGTI